MKILLKSANMRQTAAVTKLLQQFFLFIYWKIDFVPKERVQVSQRESQALEE